MNTKTRAASPNIKAAPPGEAEDLPYTCGTQDTQQFPFIQDFSPGQHKQLFHTESKPIKQNQLNTERTTLDLEGKERLLIPAQLSSSLPAKHHQPCLCVTLLLPWTVAPSPAGRYQEVVAGTETQNKANQWGIRDAARPAHC